MPLTPGLVPLCVANDELLCRELAGISQEVELAVRVGGAVASRLRGPMLWTHFGVSGPVALNVSRHWLRAQLEGRCARLTASFYPGQSFEEVDGWWMARAAEKPRSSVQSALASTTPNAFADRFLERAGIDGAPPLAHFPRADRRRLVQALIAWPLAVTSSRGYTFAEVTAGGVALPEIDPATLESRVVPGLYLVGEILDVDGRIGGFNFQWAWSTARVAGEALARR